ncbi:hypothetical protein NE237_003599 [Protea cynaroides]|uniref:F-box protein n=1 Tax=Protea cynaroides TaxID=273540 RepID=A0A9Q0QSR3_9MAGN|nr:hypothetical protein NE237_003599 [Protea cynaroides]
MKKLMLSNSNGDKDEADLYYCTDEILTEILIRLPLKPVLRCKCVSKRWFHLISDPCFRTSYLSHGSRRRYRRRLIGFFKTPTDFDTYVWKFLPKVTTTCPKIEEEPSQQVILDSETNKFEEGEEDIISSLESSQGILKSLGYFMCYSNGLFLCSNIKNMYYIYNPISKEYYRLPHPPKKQVNHNWKRPILGLVVAADYDKVCSGQLQFRYKVVRAEASRSSMDTRDLIEIETFFSDTGEWTESKVAVTVETYNHFSYSRLYASVIRGVIHWMNHRSIIFVYDPNSCGEKHIQKIDPPAGNYVRPSIIGESSDGLLQLVALDETHNFIDVWVYLDSVNKEGREWSLRRKMVQVFPVPPSIGRNSFNPVSLVALHPDNPEAVFINLTGYIYLYHLDTTPRLEAIQYRANISKMALMSALFSCFGFRSSRVSNDLMDAAADEHQNQKKGRLLSDQKEKPLKIKPSRAPIPVSYFPLNSYQSRL